jgi:hypothetical protein
MKRTIFRAAGALALAALVSTWTLPVDAGGAAHTRPPSGGAAPSSGHASGSASGGAHASAGHAQGHAQGHATYGYGYYPGGGGYYPYYPYYGDWYYGPWWSAGLWWGWPGYWGDAWWYGYPSYYGYPGAYTVYGDDHPIGPALVVTNVNPKKAHVTLDGEPIGEARDFNGSLDALALDPGRHQFVFEAPGCMSLEVNLDAKAGRRYQIAYDLRSGEGRDPRSNAATPPDTPATERPPDERGAPPPPLPGQAGERVEAGIQRGFLKVQVSPPDAAVYLDGEFLGRGDELARLHGAIPVAAGQHRIEVVRPGYRSWTQTVEVGGSPQPAEVRINLDREGSSAL